MIPFITCEISLGQNGSKLVLGVNVCDLNIGVQIDSNEQPIKSNSVGSGYVSRGWTSALDDHLDHRFIIFKKCRASHQNEKTSRLRKHYRRCIIQDHCAELESSLGSWCVFLMMCHAAGSLQIVFGIFRLVGRRMQHFNSQIPKMKTGNSIHS